MKDCMMLTDRACDPRCCRFACRRPYFCRQGMGGPSGLLRYGHVLGIMFLVAWASPHSQRHFLAKYVWKVPRTPWLRFSGSRGWSCARHPGLALVGTSFWLTVLIYLSFAALVNRALLARLAALLTHGDIASSGTGSS